MPNASISMKAELDFSLARCSRCSQVTAGELMASSTRRMEIEKPVLKHKTGVPFFLRQITSMSIRAKTFFLFSG